MAFSILLAACAYIFGSIPTANVLAKVLRGVDLRNYGSRSVSASNAGELLGKWAMLVVGVGDALKGAAPVWIAQALGQELPAQMAIGLAGVAGHNWSMFLGCKGGRGLASMIGVLLALAQLELLLFTVIALLGLAFTVNPPVSLAIATALLPLWSATFERPAPFLWGMALIVVLVAAKRLEGNREALPRRGRLGVIANRLVLDRDTRSRQEWVRRTHDAAGPAQEPAP
ncbi:MAG: acyl-phosphate glycerol 3-phosphate acyltransferase [Dehalococcoidia bacterium]|nr:acyl-phosphate glycerol 3-phosphate acyltransferase [Dehalococcoidia bacterium]